MCRQLCAMLSNSGTSKCKTHPNNHRWTLRQSREFKLRLPHSTWMPSSSLARRLISAVTQAASQNANFEKSALPWMCCGCLRCKILESCSGGLKGKFKVGICSMTCFCIKKKNALKLNPPIIQKCDSFDLFPKWFCIHSCVLSPFDRVWNCCLNLKHLTLFMKRYKHHFAFCRHVLMQCITNTIWVILNCIFWCGFSQSGPSFPQERFQRTYAQPVKSL